jgi:hypothetical protein
MRPRKEIFTYIRAYRVSFITTAKHFAVAVALQTCVTKFTDISLRCHQFS